MANPLCLRSNSGTLYTLMLPHSAIARLVVLALADSKFTLTEGEIWFDVDPYRSIPWDLRRHIMSELLSSRRIERLQTRDPHACDVTRLYRIPTEPALKGLSHETA